MRFLRVINDNVEFYAKVVERFETRGVGGLIFHPAMRIPYSNFPKGPLRCSLAQANLFGRLTASIVSVIIIGL